MNNLEEQNYRRGFSWGVFETEYTNPCMDDAIYTLGYLHGKRGKNKQRLKKLLTGEKASIYYPTAKEIRHILKQHNL